MIEPLLFALRVLAALRALGPALHAAETTPSSITFNHQEQAYIDQATTIMMCVDPDWVPFEQIDEEGKHVGIAADLVQLVAQRVRFLPTRISCASAY